MEVKVTAEHLVRSFTAKHHFDAHALDDACQQIHRSGGADGGYVVSLDKIDYIAYGVQPFLNGIVDFVVNRTDVSRHFARLDQVGSAFQPHCEGMELRPPGIGFIVCLDAFGGISLGNGGDDG